MTFTLVKKKKKTPASNRAFNGRRWRSSQNPAATATQNLTRFLAFKHAHFTAVAHYRRSLDDLGANRYGDELGRLRICERALADVLKPGGGGGGGGGGKRGVPEAVVRDLKVRVGDKVLRCYDDGSSLLRIVVISQLIPSFSLSHSPCTA